MSITRTSKLPQELHELTAARAFAAFIVVIFHMFFSQHGNSGVLGNIVSDGHLGVDFFFLLSGFILAHVYARSWRDKTFQYNEFLIKRFARVYPLHLFMIILYFAAYEGTALIGIATQAEGQNWQHLPFHAFLLHAWGTTDAHSWNFPSWSVSAEFFAYLIFPVVLMVCLKFKQSLVLLGAIMLFFAASVFAWNVLDQHITKLMYNFGILRIFAEFTIGVALYLTLERYQIPRRLVRPILFGSLAVILCLAAVQADERLILITMIPLLAALAEHATLERPSILRSKVCVYLGEISYATYMVHMLVVTTVAAVAPRLGLAEAGWQASLISLALIYLGSAILYAGIERPARALFRKPLRASEGSTSAPPASAPTHPSALGSRPSR